MLIRPRFLPDRYLLFRFRTRFFSIELFFGASVQQTWPKPETLEHIREGKFSH